MNTISRNVFMIAAASSLCVAASVFSQDQQPSLPGSKSETTKAPAKEHQTGARPRTSQNLGPGVSIRFNGGTLVQYAEAVRKSAGSTPINIALARGTESIDMPAVTMENVNAMFAVMAIEKLAEVTAGKRVRVDQLTSSGDEESGRSPMYTVRLEELARVGMQQPFVPDGRVTRVLSLNDLITPPWAKEKDQDSIPAETVLTAIQTAVEAGTGKEDAPEVKYHRESGMLILHCTPGQGEAAERVIRNLQEDLAARVRRKAPPRGNATFKPVHIEPKAFVDALLAVYPDRTAGGVDYLIDKDAVKISGPETMVEGARALWRFLDREDSVMKLALNLRGEVQNLHEQMMMMQRELAGREEALRASRDQLETIRRQLVETQKSAREQSIQPK